jgi:phosphoribosylformimino-5-aminoimidazole carboxamide ribotide isomerase
MRIIPSIDLLCSKRVEVVSHDVEKVFEESDPVETAVFWEKAGASMIHVVDIDAALGTGRRNTEVIKKVIRSVKIPVQVAGGIRSREQVEELLSAGASRVVVRPRPCSRSFAEGFSGLQIVLGIDYMGSDSFRDVGKDSVTIAEDKIVSWVSELRDSTGLNSVLVTDVAAEGFLKGVRNEALGFLKKLCGTGLEIMYAGGVSSIQDVLKLGDVGVHGIVVGKALYNGLLSFQELGRVVGE